MRRFRAFFSSYFSYYIGTMCVMRHIAVAWIKLHARGREKHFVWQIKRWISRLKERRQQRTFNQKRSIVPMKSETEFNAQIHLVEWQSFLLSVSLSPEYYSRIIPKNGPGPFVRIFSDANFRKLHRMQILCHSHRYFICSSITIICVFRAKIYAQKCAYIIHFSWGEGRAYFKIYIDRTP